VKACLFLVAGTLRYSLRDRIMRCRYAPTCEIGRSLSQRGLPLFSLRVLHFCHKEKKCEIPAVSADDFCRELVVRSLCEEGTNMSKATRKRAAPRATLTQIKDLTKPLKDILSDGCHIIHTPDGRVYRVCHAKAPARKGAAPKGGGAQSLAAAKAAAPARARPKISQVRNLMQPLDAVSSAGCQIITTPDGRVYKVCP
jgi:hypothetical protein